MLHKKITFIGAGNMATSIISGLSKDGYPSDAICACGPRVDESHTLVQQFSIQHSQDNAASARWAEVVVLGVKPQMMASVCQALADAGVDFKNKLVISIAAGVSVQRLQSLLGKETPVIRTMPNTPSLLQKGMSGLFASSQATSAHKDIASALLQAVGEILWVDAEHMIDAVTATSGSGPAYFFLFMEAMHEKAQKMGFTDEQARKLVQQTALGSAAMVQSNPDISISTLRENVTSKGGTTAAALDSFNAQGLKQTVEKSMQAAADRGAEMQSLF